MIYSQPTYPQTYPQFQQSQIPIPQPQVPQVPQIQTGFMSVRSEQEARNYAVAPGNSVMFKDENSPYVYTKTMGFSQLDRPQFEKYRLVKEEVDNAVEQTTEFKTETPNYLIADDLNPIFDKLEDFKNRINELQEELDKLNKQSVKQVYKRSTKKLIEVEDDDD
jgi:hypothetical protein